ncbi:hypothetical protein P4233_30980 [Pseudomonas aeruginosa]|nr:hypothetical protein [Pseudomonas aeruginosa]
MPKPAQKSDFAERLNARLMGNLQADMAPAGRRVSLTWSTRAGGPVADTIQRRPARAVQSAAQALDNFARQLGELLGKPLVIQVQTDSDAIAARVERRAGIR